MTPILIILAPVPTAALITYHKAHGEVSRVTVSFDMVKNV